MCDQTYLPLQARAGSGCMDSAVKLTATISKHLLLFISFSQPVQGEESCPRPRAMVGSRRTNIFSLASKLVEPNLRAVLSDEADLSTEHVHLCFCCTLHLSWYHHRRESDRARRRGLEDECDKIAYVQRPWSIPGLAFSRPFIYKEPYCRNMNGEYPQIRL